MDVVGYLDAGTGSMLLQILVGGIAAVGVTARLYWRRIKSVFGRGEAEPEHPTEH
ncbi:MAG TPA: hypothetical protein VF545_03675 [Thermoleophilaceae bacterium]|jgi:hypothetical protein